MRTIESALAAAYRKATGLLDANGKDWKPDSSSNNRDWLLEINDDEGVIANDKVEPGIAKDRWICGGGPENVSLSPVSRTSTPPGRRASMTVDPRRPE